VGESIRRILKNLDITGVFRFSLIILYGHSCASFLVAQGLNMKTVQLWMGHANFQITADTYSHLETSALQVPATILSDLLADEEENDE